MICVNSDERELEMAKDSAHTVRVRLSGRVTGVGFRWSACREAERYPGLRGWIRNVGPGQVEALLSGPEPELAAMLEWLRHGPPGAIVRECVVSPEPVPQELPPFSLNY